MPNYSLWYAYGPYVVREAIPSSAFSAGDLLQYDSGSSLSRMNVLFPSGADIAGVALSASTSSVDDRVPYLIPTGGTVFWSEATAGSQMTPGEELDFEYTSARWFVTTSTNSVRAVVQVGTQDITGQSVQSRVLIQLIEQAGYLEHS